MRTINKPIILLLLCLAQFMVVLDVAIVNVALPSIQTDLHIGADAVQWVIIAYGLTLGGFLLLGGRAADLLGRRSTLSTGLVVFTAASLLAGLSGSSEVLIAARAVQGFGAALIPPAALSILATTFPEGPERNKAVGIFGATTGISASVGVTASGLLTDGPGWRWVFFINLPIGVLLLTLAAAFLLADKPTPRREPFDAAGALTITSGLVLLSYAITRGAQHGWTSVPTLGLAAAAVVTLAAFVGIETRSAAPLVPAVAVRNRTLVAANLSALTTFGAFFAFIFLGSLLMQQSLGYSAVKTGLAWLATTAVSVVAAVLTGEKLVGVFGVRRLLIAGQALLAAAVLLLTRVPTDAHYATDLLPALLLAGIAGGLSAPAAQIGALSGVTPDFAGLASGLIETGREIGGALGVASVSTMLITRTGVDAFHAAFWVVASIAATGAVVSAIAFPRTRPSSSEPESEPQTVAV
jgi:EmrB/QacA subfamily drug resistance transporter